MLEFPRLSLSLTITLCFSASALGVDPVLKRTSTMVLEPSAASLAGGKANLTTSALRLQAGRYIGNYQLKVFPYAFKNETGSLSIGVSGESLRKLSSGTPVSFTGTAVTSGSKKTRPVTVLATPAASGVLKGKLTITIATENGAIVFDPAYTLASD